MSNNRCATCVYKNDPDRRGHCYMFRVEPQVCMISTNEEQAVSMLTKWGYTPPDLTEAQKGSAA